MKKKKKKKKKISRCIGLQLLVYLLHDHNQMKSNERENHDWNERLHTYFVSVKHVNIDDSEHGRRA